MTAAEIQDDKPRTRLPRKKSFRQIERLKDQLESTDWHLEDTPGFERHYDELKAWRLERVARHEADIEERRLQKIRDIAAMAVSLGCSLSLAEVIYDLKQKVEFHRFEWEMYRQLDNGRINSLGHRIEKINAWRAS